MTISFAGIPTTLRTPNDIKKWVKDNSQELNEALNCRIQQQFYQTGIVYDSKMPKRIAHRWKRLRSYKKRRIITESQFRNRLKSMVEDVLKGYETPCIKPAKVTIDPNDRTRLNVEMMLPPILSQRLREAGFLLAGI